MRPFQEAKIPEPEFEASVAAIRSLWKKDKLTAMLGREYSAEDLEKMCAGLRHDWENDKVYRNNVYQVNVTRHPEIGLVELSIRRIDRQTIRNWRHLQQIKNELVGPEHEGFEMFPAESRLVDTANQYYMWVITDNKIRLDPIRDPVYRLRVFDDPNRRLPIGYRERAVSASNLGKSKNKFVKDERRTLPSVS